MMMNRELFRQETIKPKNLSNTLARLGAYFGKFWYMLLLVLVLHHNLHLDSSDHPRTHGTSHRLFPRADGKSVRVRWELRADNSI